MNRALADVQSLPYIPTPQASKETILEIKGLSKQFTVKGKALQIFDTLSVSIQTNSFVSIIGPSGCGKSTLLKMISGLESPTNGEIIFEGKLVSGAPKGMIYVFQQYTKSIFPWKTVIENVEFGIKNMTKMPKKERREKCGEYLKLVGLEGYDEHYPSQLSGGMQQRLAIARALICEPRVILMDEPFSAVDAMTRAKLQQLIMKIWEQIPITILFVTHDVEEAVFLSNRVLSLRKSPGGIENDLQIDLSHPRHPIETREDQKFVDYSQRLFANIFQQEADVT
ncbi:ABC transporter ATP-binding protein [Paenibacillus sp. S3N08]|uniref:ABC transporter ATP-binding protein n=2 Tax=Paenibacillus agricola TaxID=2716264 RepID=A0ABX0JD10_9BACL|nr:ABC transporter ATP-binding protein [Paenibacillus agricola]